MLMCLWTPKTNAMTKFIFTITTAVASMLGQVYDQSARTVLQTKTEKFAPAQTDSVSCHSKKEMRNVLTPNKKQLPS